MSNNNKTIRIQFSLARYNNVDQNRVYPNVINDWLILIVIYFLGLAGSRKPEMIYSLAFDAEFSVFVAGVLYGILLLVVPALEEMLKIEAAARTNGVVKVKVLLVTLLPVLTQVVAVARKKYLFSVLPLSVCIDESTTSVPFPLITPRSCESNNENSKVAVLTVFAVVVLSRKKLRVESIAEVRL
jgi:hypothetical protein